MTESRICSQGLETSRTVSRCMHKQDIPESLQKILVEILSTILDIMALSAKRIHDGRLSKSGKFHFDVSVC